MKTFSEFIAESHGYAHETGTTGVFFNRDESRYEVHNKASGKVLSKHPFKSQFSCSKEFEEAKLAAVEHHHNPDGKKEKIIDGKQTMWVAHHYPNPEPHGHDIKIATSSNPSNGSDYSRILVIGKNNTWGTTDDGPLVKAHPKCEEIRKKFWDMKHEFDKAKRRKT
jgi:hypothetical protein